MAENENDVEQKDIPEVIEDSLSKTEVLLEENKKLISNVVLGLAIVIAGYFAYNNFIAGPQEEAALDAIYPAQQGFENPTLKRDSIAEEFLSIADDFGSTEAGNVAGLYAGIALMESGDFEGALEAIEGFSAAGKLTPGLKLGLIGDCQSELGEVESAVSNYKKAADLLDSKSGSSYFLKKAGILLEQNGQASDAVEVYELALSKYLSDVVKSTDKTEIEKLLFRAKSSK